MKQTFKLNSLRKAYKEKLKEAESKENVHIVKELKNKERKSKMFKIKQGNSTSSSTNFSQIALKDALGSRSIDFGSGSGTHAGGDTTTKYVADGGWSARSILLMENDRREE